MPIRCQASLSLALMSVVAAAAVAQTLPVAVAVYGGTGLVMAGGIFLQNVKGHPFSAEQDVDAVQTLGDGTRITPATQKTLLYRDTEGRTRTEHIFTPPPGAVIASVPSFISITDPVAGYRYTLDQGQHVARRTVWESLPRRLPQRAAASKSATVPAGAPTASAANGARPEPQFTQEPLGTQTIEGLAAEGKRTTVVYPEGFMGNDRPITAITETWTSPELGMVVLSKTSDPRTGETTSKLTNISFDEPDPALFEVPAGYSIVDEQPIRTTTAVRK